MKEFCGIICWWEYRKWYKREEIEDMSEEEDEERETKDNYRSLHRSEKMGRKHQNRRGKVGRRARARKAKNSETAEQMLGLVGGKFDAPPKSGDDSVLSTKKLNKHPVLDQTVDEPLPVSPTPAVPSGSRARHEQMKKNGLIRKKLIHKISTHPSKPKQATQPKDAPQAKETPKPTKPNKPYKPIKAKEVKMPVVPKTLRLPKEAEISDKPKFGETVHAPSDRISKLGKILANKNFSK